MPACGAGFAASSVALAIAALAGGAAPLATASAPAGAIVFSADELPALNGEIYRVDANGHRVDLSNSPFADTQPFVSPDGKRVAFFSDRSGRQALYEVGINRGGLVRMSAALPQGLAPDPVGWLPDSRHFLMVTTRSAPNASSGGENVVQELVDFAAGRAPRTLARSIYLNGIDYPTVSPDGRFVAYRDDGLFLRVISTGQARAYELDDLNGLGGSLAFAWSRQDRLAVVQGSAVRVIDTDGNQLGHFEAQVTAWSPSGRQLASIDGAWLELRDRGGAGQVLLRKRVVPASVIRAIVKFGSGYQPQLVWLDERHLLLGNVTPGQSSFSGPGLPSPSARASVEITLPAGALTAAKQQSWFDHSCGCLSRDGSRVVDTTKSGSGFAIRVRRTNGSGIRLLGNVAGCWSDDSRVAAVFGLQYAAGNSVVYQSSCPDPPAHLYSLNPGSPPTQMTSAGTLEEVDPAWSPDGSKVAYVQDGAPETCQGCNSTLEVMNADGTGLKQLTAPSPDDSPWITDPSWSPDGSKIIYAQSTTDSPDELFVVPSDGGPSVDLRIAGASPAWGPTRIAYLANTNLGGSKITLTTIASDGSDKQAIATGAFGSCAWSSSGTLAAIEGRASIMEVSASGLKTRIALPFADVDSVAWSPDGTQLLVSARMVGAGPYDLYTVEADGSSPQRLTTNADAFSATWTTSP